MGITHAKRDVMDRIGWDSWTSVLGTNVQGIWRKGGDKTDINACDRSHSETSVATGDDFGKVRLFEFQCEKKGASFQEYVGHSAHVTNVRFVYDDSYLITTGGNDASVLVWKCTGKKGKKKSASDSLSDFSDLGSDSDFDTKSTKSSRRTKSGKSGKGKLNRSLSRSLNVPKGGSDKKKKKGKYDSDSDSDSDSD